MREYNQIRNEQRMQQQEKWEQERRENKAKYEMERRARRAEQLDTEHTYIGEITLVEQTILFCKSLVQPKGPEQKEEKSQAVTESFEGAELLVKKEDRDEYYFVPTAKGKKGKKSKGGKTEGSSKPIKHNAETFRLFDQLKLDAPITTDDIAPTLEKLDAKLEYYKEKVKKYEVEREEMKRKILAGEDVEDDDQEEQKVVDEKEKAEEQ